MTSLRQWLRPPKALLLLLFLLTFASVSTLAIFGWRLLEQQRIVEAQRSQDRLEYAADRIAAMVREALAKSSERIGAGLVSQDDVLLTLTPSSFDATPPGRLLYYPFSPPDPEPHSKIFAEAELFEFVESEPAEALHIYESLCKSADASVRAGALLRTARVLRNLGKREQSLDVYRHLADLNENVAGAPASLVAALAITQLSNNPQAALNLLDDLSCGRWRLARGQFEFFWSEAGRLTGHSAAPPAEKNRLTQIAEFVWNDRANHPESRGYATEWVGDAPVLLIWRDTVDQSAKGADARRQTTNEFTGSSGGATSAQPVGGVVRGSMRPATVLRGSPIRRVLVTRPAALIQNPPDTDVRYAFVDAKGHTLAGVKDRSSHSVVRTAAESELPWTLFVSENKPVATNQFVPQQRFLLLGLSIMMLFLLLGTYFIARAIQREAETQRMQSNFVSAVSHEFRSPLTSMRQLSEMLAMGRVSCEQRRQLYYETLVKETSRLQRLIEALLNFGRMEAGASRYRFEQQDATALVENVVCEFAPQVASAGKRIEASPTKGPLWIEADSDAISVALSNLLDNAIKYSPGQTTVYVECGLDQGRVAIRVRDQGLGIPESERRTIFKKFMRGSAAIAANVKGSGIGLAMVSHIVAAHGGEITVASEIGRGSMFTMLLPAAERT